MINAKFDFLKESINLDDNINFVVIENKNLIYNTIEKLKEDINDSICFYNSRFERVYSQKEVEVVYDYFSMNSYTQKVLLDYIKVKNINFDPLINDKLMTLFSEFQSIVNEVELLTPLSIETNDSITIDALFKSMSARFQSKDNKLEKLIDYCKINIETYKIKVFIFININLYFTLNEIKQLNEEITLIDAKTLFVSSTDLDIKNSDNIKIYYIDNDLCEFTN